MFVTKKYHLAELNRLTDHFNDRLKLLNDGYTGQIDVMFSQIEDLRSLVFPKMPKVVDPITYEADSVLSNSEKPLEQSESERNAYLAGERELDLLISGNYTDDLLN